MSILNFLNQEVLTEVLDANEDIHGQRGKLVDDDLGHGHVRVGFMHEAEMEESFTEETSPANVPADSDVRRVVAQAGVRIAKAKIRLAEDMLRKV